MKRALLVVGFSAFTLTSMAHAAGPYVGAAGGLTIVHDGDVSVSGLGSAEVSYDVGGGLGISAGYDFGGPRLEFEFGYRAADVDEIGGTSISDTDVSYLSYMVNAFYDFKTQTPFTPFLGVGIGAISGEVSVQSEDADDTQFAYQGIVGASYAMNQNVNLDLSYRLQGSTDFEDAGIELEYMSSNIFVGLRYTFGAP